MAIGGEPVLRHEDHGATLAAISRRIVGLLKEHYGKGPTQARTYYSETCSWCCSAAAIRRLRGR